MPGTEHGHGSKKVDAATPHTVWEQYKVQGNPSAEDTLVGLRFVSSPG